MLYFATTSTFVWTPELYWQLQKRHTHPYLATINSNDLCSEILRKSGTILQAKSCLENLWTLGVHLQQGKPATLAAVEAPVLKLFFWIIIVPQHDIVTSLPLLPCVWVVLKTFNVSLNVSRLNSQFLRHHQEQFPDLTADCFLPSISWQFESHKKSAPPPQPKNSVALPTP